MFHENTPGIHDIIILYVMIRKTELLMPTCFPKSDFFNLFLIVGDGQISDAKPNYRLLHRYILMQHVNLLYFT